MNLGHLDNDLMLKYHVLEFLTIKIDVIACTIFSTQAKHQDKAAW